MIACSCPNVMEVGRGGMADTRREGGEVEEVKVFVSVNEVQEGQGSRSRDVVKKG